VKRAHILITGLAALLLVAGACLAADSPITLRGRVVDENGLPVGGAQVKLEMTGGQTFWGTTDDAGAFSVPNLAAGEYTAHIASRASLSWRGRSSSWRRTPGKFRLR